MWKWHKSHLVIGAFLSVVLCITAVVLVKRQRHFTHFLKPIELTTLSTGLPFIDCIYVINLDERPERWSYAKRCFDEQGLSVNRFSAINGWKIPLKKRKKLMEPAVPLLSGGALGCLLSHLSIYQDAVKRGFRTVWVCEDDIEFKEKAEVISSLVQQLNQIDPEWDLLYTDYSERELELHPTRPGQVLYRGEKEVVSDDLMRIYGRYNTHSLLFSERGLKKIMSYFAALSLSTPIDVDLHYVPGIREYSLRRDVVTSINDSSVLAVDGSSDTQVVSPLNSSSR